MHRGLLATIGRERTGWVSVQLLLDHFARRELAVKLDATRDGATQPILLDRIQLDRLIYELTYARLVMMTKGQSLEERDGDH
ncbi:precorrin-4 C11-methyltransferase [Verrucosispora sp. FIM060022]|nr:precorrin-4 C11-methyltransferase [Verrucosispora sp. FIM060022]